MATPIDNNCVTHTVALLKPGETPPDNSPFWCHGCRVRRHIVTRIDMHACSPSRTAQALQHLLEAIPVRPRWKHGRATADTLALRQPQ